MQSQTNAAMTDYGKWLGNRYKNQGNIIWVHGGDANANNYTNAYDRVAAIANGIKLPILPVFIQLQAAGQGRVWTITIYSSILTPYIQIH